MFGFTKKHTITLKVHGMTCQHCAIRVAEALNALDGVRAKVNLAAGEATVTCPESMSAEALIETVKDAGYSAVV